MLFEIGGTYRVMDNTSHHGFEIDDEIILKKFFPKGEGVNNAHYTAYLVDKRSGERPDICWYINQDDIGMLRR